jgi:hypothetical protein
MKKILILAGLIFPFYLFSQNIEDALRFSRTENFSTARSMGVAGSFGAMGADFGAISYNPATLGNYWKGEMVFSLGTQSTKSFGQLENNGATTYDQAFTFDNIGLVSNWKNITKEKIISRSFAIGLNSVASYNYDLNVEGTNPGSILEDGDLFSGVDYGSFSDYKINKLQRIKESGSQKELFFAYGQNHNDMLLWGFSVGIPFINYSTERDYSETAPDAVINNPDIDFYFKNVQYSTAYSTVGVGVNFKAGVIAKLPAKTRVGLSVHTPSMMKLKDDYNEYLEVKTINFWIFDTIDYEGYFDYNLKTPWKFIGSAGKIFGNENIGGFVNMDAEFISNAGMKFNYHKYSSSSDDLDAEKEINNKLQKDLKGAFNIRVGAELAIKKFRLRGGAAFYDSPFKSDSDYNPATVLSTGIGYRGDSFYIDLAYVNSKYNYAYYPYVAENRTRSPRIDIDKTINKLNATVGLKF